MIEILRNQKHRIWIRKLMTFTEEIFATPELQKCNVYFHDMDFFTKIFLTIQLTGILLMFKSYQHSIENEV